MDNRLEPAEILEVGAKGVGVCLSMEMISNLLVFIQKLKEWNNRFNLTAITLENEVLLKHLVDSLAPSPYLPHGASILDIGSGAGLPGIPLKIVRSDLRVTLLDSSRKKIHFQKHVIRTLKLCQIQTIQTRAEDAIGRNPDMRRHYDAVLSRAFSSLKFFIELGKPFIKENGFLIAFKGPGGTAELSRLEPWLAHKSMRIAGVEYRLPYLEHDRRLYIVRRLRNGEKSVNLGLGQK
ncbi:MAG: 16S rRNA (guanine(527)-N(7))-methyltransferase RsmG [Desulfobacteria bacterium]